MPQQAKDAFARVKTVMPSAVLHSWDRDFAEEHDIVFLFWIRCGRGKPYIVAARPNGVFLHKRGW